MTGRRWAAIVAALLAAWTIWVIRASGVNHDVAWFVEVARQVRDGVHLYGAGLHDPRELNPPLAIWLFLPMLALASTLSLPPTLVPTLLVALEAIVALAVTWRLLWGLSPVERPWAMVATAAAMLSLAGYDFAQREHQLVILLTPALWSLALCVANHPPSRGARIAAGALAGIGVAFKPHFVLAWAVVEIGTAIAARRPRLVWRAEPLTAAGMTIAYAGAVLTWAPDYLPFIRGAAPGYFASQAEPLASLLTQPEALLALVGLGVVLACRSEAPLALAGRTFALAGVAFALVAIAQRKNFSYHWLPAVSWSALAAALSAANVGFRRPTFRQFVPNALLLVLVVAVAATRLRVGVLRAELHRETARQIVRAIGPVADARDLVILSVPVEGPFPAATYLGLRWPMGMPPGFMGLAMERPAMPPTMPDPDQATREAVWEDLAAARPRFIAVSPLYTRSAHPVASPTRTIADFFAVDPRLAALFARYEPIARIDRLGRPYYVILRRTTAASATAR